MTATSSMATPQRVAIVGAGGHGRECADLIEAINRHSPTYTFVGFVDDVRPLGQAPEGLHVIGRVEALEELDAAFVVAIGDCGTRERLAQRIGTSAPLAPALVHPAAVTGSRVKLAPGCIVAAGTHLTTNVSLGIHTHVNVNSSVSHDCEIADFVTVGPGCQIGGNVTIARGSYIGIGATIIQGVSIGEEAIVGAGAVVVRDVDPGSTVVGVPARRLRK